MDAYTSRVNSNADIYVPLFDNLQRLLVYIALQRYCNMNTTRYRFVTYQS